MNQRGFSFKKCMVGLVLAIAMVIQTPVSGFAADVCTQSNVVQAEGYCPQTYEYIQNIVSGLRPETTEN